MIILPFKISKINLGEARMIGTKLDWCGKTVLLHYKLGSLEKLKNLLQNLQTNQELFES